jgi:hypothetical protein
MPSVEFEEHHDCNQSDQHAIFADIVFERVVKVSLFQPCCLIIYFMIISWDASAAGTSPRSCLRALQIDHRLIFQVVQMRSADPLPSLANLLMML